MGGYRKSESNVHARRIPFHRRIQESLYLAERHDLVKPSFNFGPGHTQYGSIEVDILSTGEFWVKTGANFQKTRYSPLKPNSSVSRLRDTAQDLQQRALTSPISADNPKYFALLHVKIHVF